MSIVCYFDPSVIKTHFNMLQEADYYFIHCNHRRRNSNAHKSRVTTSLHGEHWSKSSLSVDLKKRGKGWAYRVTNHNLGCASIRNQFRKILVEERRRSGACHQLSSKIKISLCAVWKTTFNLRRIQRFCNTSFRSSRLQAPKKFCELDLFWCAQ